MKNIKEFCEAYKAKRFMNTKQGVDERIEWLRNELEIKSYIPFKTKREIAEMIVSQNIKVEDGIKKYDSISGYVSLIVASIVAHTNLQFSPDPILDYDLLAESGLLPQIIAQFQSSHDEIDIILKMALAMELEDNSVPALIGKFLNNLLDKLSGLSDGFKNAMGNIDLKELLGEELNKENLTKLTGLINKLK